MTDELNAGEVVVMLPKAELERLRAHDKEATALTIDQQVEIGRLSFEVERLRAELGSDESIDREVWKVRCERAEAEVEYVKANYVTVAEEAQRRHDACAPLTAEIGRLRGLLAKHHRHISTGLCDYCGTAWQN